MSIGDIRKAAKDGGMLQNGRSRRILDTSTKMGAKSSLF